MSIPPDADPLLDVRDVMALTRLSKDNLYARHRRNEGPPSFRLGRRIVWRRSGVLAYLAEQERETGRGYGDA